VGFLLFFRPRRRKKEGFLFFLTRPFFSSLILVSNFLFLLGKSGETPTAVLFLFFLWRSAVFLFFFFFCPRPAVRGLVPFFPLSSYVQGITDPLTRGRSFPFFLSSSRVSGRPTCSKIVLMNEEIGRVAWCVPPPPPSFC